MNQITLIGNVTRDPETYYTQTGTAVSKFGLAVNRAYKKDGQKVTDFFDLVAWGKTAELVDQWVKKGSKVAVLGEMRREDWTDKEGQKRTSWKVNVDKVEFLPSGRKGAEDAATDDTVDGPLENDDRSIDEDLERGQPYGF